MAHAQVTRDALRCELQIAMRERKAIELLKARRLAEYRARAARIEEEELDEANLQ